MDIRIVGTGSAVPDKVLTNDMLAQMVDTDDEWIWQRTGIRERRIVEGETGRDLSRDAATAALAAAEKQGIKREQVGVIICASMGTKHDRCPSMACNLQRDLGLRENVFAYDLNAACSGFIYALIAAARFVDEDNYALVVGCDVLSQFTDFTDRSTCILFGDAAGAVVVGPAPEVPEAQGTGFHWVTEASGSDLLIVQDYVRMDGQGVFKFAVEAIVRNARAVVEKAQIALEDIDLFICHQANARIIKSAAKRLGVPLERFFMNLDKYANTSAASVPLALDEAVSAGLVKAGDKVVFVGFGGGMTAGATCFTWR